MPRMTLAEYHSYQMRTAAQHNSRQTGQVDIKDGGDTAFAVPIESELHKQILAWCDTQLPCVPYIHARMDQRSTIGEGCQDFTIFYRNRVFCIECKSKTGKRDGAQVVWAFLMEKQGFTVHVVRSFQQFLELVK